MDALPFCHLALTAAKPKTAAYPTSLTTLGDRIRARRLDLGLLQKDVGAQIICTVDTITNWELNRCQPELQYIPRIIEFLGYDPTEQANLQSIGIQIRAKRRRLGLTIRQLARILETDFSNLQHWETGRSQPTKKSVQLINRFLSAEFVHRA
jgi:transcriptional regulator with XRE-family HTH domain